MNRHEQLRLECEAFHKAHPIVWTLFERFTADRIARGFKNYSVNAIFERIRWETDEARVDETEFKLNNNYRAFYARRFMRKFPQYAGFFRTRKQTSKDEAAVYSDPLGPDDFPTYPIPPRMIAP